MRLIDADALKQKLIINFSKKLEAQAIYQHLIDIVDDAPTVKTYCYYCGQKENGRKVNDTVKIEVTEHHTFAKPDDVEDLDFPNASSEDK